MKNDAGPEIAVPLGRFLLHFGESHPPPFSCSFFFLEAAWQREETS